MKILKLLLGARIGGHYYDNLKTGYLHDGYPNTLPHFSYEKRI